VVVVQDEVADDGGGEEAREGEDIGDGVYVLAGGQGREETVFDFERLTGSDQLASKPPSEDRHGWWFEGK